MGYCHYVAEIKMEGGKGLCKKARSFLNAFHAGDGGKPAEDGLYQAFQEEMKAVWGERDGDYYDTSAFSLELGGHTAGKIIESFCRYESGEGGSYYYEPLFRAFPGIRFTYEGDKCWYNNADEAQENRMCEYALYTGGEIDEASHDFWGYGKECKTMEDALEAISNNFYAIEDIPDDLKTGELYLAVISEGIGLAPETLKYVPKNLKTPGLYLAAVQADDDALENVPKRFLTKDFYKKALEENPRVFSKMPGNYKTSGLCLEAVTRNGAALEYVPDNLKTAELCHLAVKQDGTALEYVPDNLKTPGLCLAAVQAGDGALCYVPQKLLTKDFYMKALEKNPQVFVNMPGKYKTRRVCLDIVKKYGSACRDFPKRLQTEEMFIEAVKVNANGKALKYVPEEFRTFEVCLAAVQSHPRKTKEITGYVPKDLKAKVREALKS